MYDSFIISLSARLVKWSMDIYQDSSTKGIIDRLKGLLTFLFKGSLIREFFVSKRSFIEDSVFFLIIGKAMGYLNRIFANINKYIRKISKDSIIYTNASSLYRSGSGLFQALLLFFLFFGIGIGLNNIFRGLSGRSYVVASGLVMISLLGLALGERRKDLLANSYFYNIARDIFLIDEGGVNSGK